MNINKLLPKNNFTTPDAIITAVCETWNITREDILGHSRTQPLAFARHLAMWLVYEHTHLTLALVGQLFGGRDHTTVYAAKKRINKVIHNKSVKRLIKAVRDHSGIDDNLTKD